MFISSASKSCPYCRVSFDRVDHHITSCHPEVIVVKKIRDNICEKRRANFAAQSSYNLLELKAKFPDNYLDVAEFMTESGHFPVFLPRTEKYVENLTVEQLRKWKIRPGIQPGVLKGTEQPKIIMFKTKVKPVGELPTVPLPVAVAHRRRLSADEAIVEESAVKKSKTTLLSLQPGTSQPEEPMSPEQSAAPIETTESTEPDVISPQSTISEDVVRPTKLLTIRRILDSDSEPEDTEEPAEPQKPALPEKPAEPEKLPKPQKQAEPEQPVCCFSPLRTSTKNTVDVVSVSVPVASTSIAEIPYLAPSDTSNSNGDEPEPQPESYASRVKSITEKYKLYNMDVSVTERDACVEKVKILKLLKNHYTSLIEDITAEKTINNNLSLACKIIKFCAPKHELAGFCWKHLSVANVDVLVSTLRHKIEIAPNYIANYLKVTNHLLNTMMKDEEYCAGNPQASYYKKLCAMRVKELQKANAKHISKKRNEQVTTDMYQGSAQFEDDLCKVFKAFEDAKTDCKALLDKASSTKLDAWEASLVNGFFNLLSLTCGNRPLVFKNMKVSVYKMAKRNPKTFPDGTRYYYLATSEHKTGAQYVAFMYFTEELMEMLKQYFRYVRHAAGAFEEFLFTNSNGRPIHNHSNDLTSFLEKYDKELSKVMNHRLFSKILTTLGSRFLDKEKQQIVHGMLTHSEATANKDYMIGTDKSVPHKLGIPLIGELLQKCSQ